MIRNNGTIAMDLWSTDWKFAKGHRIAIRVADANNDWWTHVADEGDGDRLRRRRVPGLPAHMRARRPSRATAVSR